MSTTATRVCAAACVAAMSAVVAAPNPRVGPNMNGGYLIANGRASPKAQGKHAQGFTANYADYPSPASNPVRFFDVYSPPIRTQYSQVFWTMMPNVALPDDVVKEFDGRAIAIVGYESDQVQRTPEGNETRVPITWAYNHHYGPVLAGSNSELKQVTLEGDHDPRDPHTGHPTPDGKAWIVVPKCASLGQTWHDEKSNDMVTIVQRGCVLTATCASATWSPATGNITGDKINMEFGGPTGKLVGSMANDKIEWSNNAQWQAGGPAPNPLPVHQTFYIGNGGEYRKSYHGFAPGYAQVLDSPKLFHIQPMQIDTKNRDGSMDRAEQGFTSGPVPKASRAPVSGPDASYSGLLECPCTDRISKVISPTYASQHTGACAVPTKSAEECFRAAEELGLPHISTSSGASTTRPAGCSVSSVVAPDQSRATSVYFNTASSKVLCGGGKAAHLVGSQASAVNVTLALDIDVRADVVRITLDGPADVWYGVGLNAKAMADLPYAVVVEGGGAVSERKLAYHTAGRVLPPSVQLVSNVAHNGRRTVVLTRPLKGNTYTFDASQSLVPFIAAVGSGAKFAYHAAKTASTISLADVAAVDCVCNYPAPFGSTTGSIVYTGPVNYTTFPKRSNQTLAFRKNCRAEPHADLLAMKNPTCDLKTYQGGLSCCHHLWLLTDKEQENDFKPDIFEYQIKFRFYYQAFTRATDTTAASHQDMVRLYHQTEDAASEYDIPQCDRASGEQCEHQITAHWKVSEMLYQPNGPIAEDFSAVQQNNTGLKIMFAGGHCHAPSCISLELYNADTGKLLCRQTPVLGKTEHPDGDVNGTAYDEKGYIALPPCVWGDEKFGLTPAPLLTWGTNLTSVKRNNNTYAHLGEMASWQMRGYATS